MNFTMWLLIGFCTVCLTIIIDVIKTGKTATETIMEIGKENEYSSKYFLGILSAIALLLCIILWPLSLIMFIWADFTKSGKKWVDKL